MMNVRHIGSTLVGGAIGGGLVWICQSGSFSLIPGSMSYADLAATLLSAVGVIVAIFGGVLALAAIWGFNQLKQDAINIAEAAGTAEVREQVENGPLRDYIRSEAEKMIADEINSDRMEQRIRGRVDAVVFGRPEDRLLEEHDESGME